MGFFARSRSGKSGNVSSSKSRNVSSSKSRNVSSRKKLNNLWVEESTNEEESVGGLLSPNDQFDLEIPMKNRQPVGILKIQNAEVLNSSRCMQLQGQYTPEKLPELNDIDHNSTVSSLSGATPDFAPLKSKNMNAMKSDQHNDSATPKIKSVPVVKVLGNRIRLDGTCCGITAHTEDTDDSNSIVLSDSESRRNAAHCTVLWALCGFSEKVEHIVKEPISSPVNRMPQKFLRDTSLFDTLADEDAETNVPRVESATVESATSTKRSKTSTVSMFGMSRSKSFRKAKNFLKGKKKRKVR